MSRDTFKDELEIFRTEANSAAQFLYSWLALNALAGEHPGVLMRLRTASLFWNTIRGSLQKSAIVALGRIFDNKSPHNIGKLLKRAEDLQIFSKNALGRRKREASPGAAEWLDEFLMRAHETNASDLRRLRKEVALWRDIYKAKYKPLRDKFFAHRELPQDADELRKLIASTRVDELERMCTFLIALHDALWEAYENGREPIVRQPTHSVLEMLSSANRGRSASELVVKEARKFFENDLKG